VVIPLPAAGPGREVPREDAGPHEDVDASNSPALAEGGDLSRVLTVPNLLSLARLACIPVFVWLVLGDNRPVAGAILLAVLGATDWLDGYIARRFSQVSTLGKVMDPTADRLLLLASVSTIVAAGALPLWLAAVALAREALVSLAVVVLAALGAPRIDVLFVGKAGTFILMAAFPAFLLGYGHAAWQHDARIAAWILVTAGLLLAWVAAAAYIPRVRASLGQRRAVRGGAGEDEPSASRCLGS